MKQVSTQWYEWSRYDAATRLDTNGHFFAPAPGEPGVLIDPVPFNQGDTEHLAALGGVAAVVITDPARASDAAQAAASFACPLYVPRDRLEQARAPGAVAYDADAPLAGVPGDLDAVAAISTVSTDGHGTADTPPVTALYHWASGTMVLNEGVIGAPAGRLSLAPERQADAAAEARRLRALLSVSPSQLLLGRGYPVTHDAARALQDLVYQHDPAAFLLRQEELRWSQWSTTGSRFCARYAEHAALVGLRTIDFDLTEVPPGKDGVQLHRHDGEEELFIVLDGEGEVVTERGSYPVRAGDVCGFPPRYQVAHAFRNTGAVPLRYLAFSSPAETLEMVDYPETGVRSESTPYGKGNRFVLPEQRRVPYWEGVRVD